MRIFLMSGSKRKDSVNDKLILNCVSYLKTLPVSIEYSRIGEFDLPLYDGDIEEKQGIPENAKLFAEKISSAEKIIFSVPEYNYSVSGVFKNLIDWVSRIRPQPWFRRNILILSASPAAAGGNRGYWHTKVPLEGCGAFVYPGFFSLGNAYNEFDIDNNLKNKELVKNLNSLLNAFIDVKISNATI